MGLISKVKEQALRVLSLNDTPHRIALAFAQGVFIAFSPLLGLHFFLAFLLAWLFNLNRVAILFGAFVNNPWTFTPITLSSTWFGIELCCKAREIPPINWENITISNMAVQLKSYFFPFVLGSVLLGLLFSIIGYFLMLWTISQYRKMKKPRSAESSSTS